MTKKYNYTMKTGRPTKYNRDLILKLAEYISLCGTHQMKLPTLEGFSLYLDVGINTLLNWSKRHKEFLCAIEKLKSTQKEQLINDGMYGGKEVNQAMAIFLLKVNHGMIETSHTDITSGNKPLPAPLIDVRSDNSHKETATTEKKD